MKQIITSLILLFVITDLCAQQFKVDTLLYNGQSENRINYVVLGDGYVNGQLSDFLEDAEKLVVHLFNVYPYSQYKNYFNVFTISVPSNVSGAATDPDNLIDNYFGSTFNYAGIERLLIPTYNDRIAEVLANNFPIYDQVIMVVNSTEYGGGGGWVATTSTHKESSEIMVHELGHSFAGLSDEYWAGEQYAYETANLTQESSANLIRWKNWLNDFGIDIIPHTENPIWNKPHDYCKMQFLGRAFCAVCREQFIRIIQQITSPVDYYTPISSAIDNDIITFELTLVEPEPNTLKVEWWLDATKIESNQTSMDLVISNLNDGLHELEVLIFDSTSFDRSNNIYVSSIKWTINDSISSNLSEIIRTREQDDPIVGISSEISYSKLKTYPNPLQKTLKIEYEITNYSRVELSIVNLEGEHIDTILNEKQIPGKYEFEIDVSTYSIGLYLLIYKSGNFHQSIKLVKID